MKNNKVLVLLAGLFLFCLTSFGQSTNIRAFYVKGIDSWLGNTAQENAVLTYAQGNGYNYILFYDLGALNWTSSTVQSNLASFLSRGRANYGITQYGASGEIYSFFSTEIIPYNNSRSNAAERFDVLNYEFEFWNQASISALYCNKYLSPNGLSCDSAGAWRFAWAEFKKMDSIAAVKGLVSEIYLGWPTKGQMQQCVSKADRILLHAYRPTDVDVYAYSRGRLVDIASMGINTKIIPIFSSESSFMGPWLATHTITKPYQTYSADYTAETGTFKQFINLQGYIWFHYTYMPRTTIATASISANGPLSFCAGGNVTLTANSGTSYLWSPGGQTTQSITVSAAGTYTVRVTNSSGVQATSSPAIVTLSTSGSSPVITANGSTSFCAGGSVVLTSSAANTYLWSTGATTQSITVSASGNYTVTTNAGGCGGTSAVTAVNANSGPTVPSVTASSSLNVCPGTTLTLSSSAANGYLWSTGATTRSIVVSAAGTYWVKAYSGPNCSAQSTNNTVTMLTAPTAPSISANGSLVLTSSHPSVTLTSTTANAYSWSTAATTRAISVNTQGSYRVTITGSNGCKATSTAAVVSANGCTPPAVPTITLSGSNVINAGGSVVLTSSVAGGYLWSNGATTRTITVTAAGSYSVRAYNAGGCFSTSLTTTILVVAVRETADQLEQASTAETLNLTAYPNPAHEFLNIDFTSASQKSYTIKILDLQGREIYTRAIEAEVGLNHIELNVAEYQHGIYFGYLLSETDKQSIKVIIE